MVSLWSFCCWKTETNCAAGCRTCPPYSVLERLGMFFGETLMLFSRHLLAHFAALWLWTVCYHPLIHPVCACVCVCVLVVLTGIFLHLLIACYTPYLTQNADSHSFPLTNILFLSLSLFLPLFFYLFGLYFSYLLLFLFVFTHPFVFFFICYFLGCNGWSDVVSVLFSFFFLASLFLLAKQEVELYKYGMCQQTLSRFLSFTKRISKRPCAIYHFKTIRGLFN